MFIMLRSVDHNFIIYLRHNTLRHRTHRFLGQGVVKLKKRSKGGQRSREQLEIMQKIEQNKVMVLDFRFSLK
jgi:ERCC4-related helicase